MFDAKWAWAALVSNIQVKKICAECSTPLPHFRVFYNKSVYFSRKDVWRISIRSPASSALGAARATEILACSNFEGKIRSFGLIPSNIQVNYQQRRTLVVNALRSEQILPSNLRNCPQSWALGQIFLEKPLSIRFLSSPFCKLACFEKSKRALPWTGLPTPWARLSFKPQVKMAMI